jgi:hypothetical protein
MDDDDGWIYLPPEKVQELQRELNKLMQERLDRMTTRKDDSA